DFLLRGNVVDLAVAVVIGTAFVAIVTAFTDGIINPLLAVFGDANEIGLGFRLVADNPSTFIAIGPIITAVINFILIAAILYFVLVLPAIRMEKRRGGDVKEPLSDTDLLMQIRDLLAEGQWSAGGRHEF